MASWAHRTRRRIPPAWQAFKLNPKTRVTLDFRNASADSIIHVLSQASGIAIVKDPTLTGGLTLQSPGPQSLDDAFSMFSAVLSLKGFDLLKVGNFLEIKANGQQNGGRNGGAGAPDISALLTSLTSSSNGTRTSNGQLKVYRIKFASASALAKTINDLYSNQTADQSVLPFGNNGAGGPGGGGGGAGGGGLVKLDQRLSWPGRRPRRRKSTGAAFGKGRLRRLQQLADRIRPAEGAGRYRRLDRRHRPRNPAGSTVASF